MEYIKKINVPMALLCLVTLKLLFTDNSYAVALVALGLTGLFAYANYLKANEVDPVNEELKKDIEAIRSQISSISVKNNVKPLPDPNKRFF